MEKVTWKILVNCINMMVSALGVYFLVCCLYSLPESRFCDIVEIIKNIQTFLYLFLLQIHNVIPSPRYSATNNPLFPILYR